MMPTQPATPYAIRYMGATPCLGMLPSMTAFYLGVLALLVLGLLCVLRYTAGVLRRPPERPHTRIGRRMRRLRTRDRRGR